MKNLRTGVIGVGSMGKNHVRIYDEISNLVGISDLDEKGGNELASAYNVEYYRDYKDLLEKVDAVTIAVPTKYHFEIAKEVISKKIDLLIEKPLAINYHDSLEIVRLADEADVCLAVGHIERHNPVIKVLKEKISNNEWGETITLSSRRFSSFPGRIIDVGVVFDLAIHDLDILSYLCNSPIKSVYSLGGKNKHKDCEDYIIILVDFENGLKGLCEANWLTPTKVRSLSVTTENAHIVADYIDQKVEVCNANLVNTGSSSSFNPQIQFSKNLLPIKKDEPLKLELIDFLNSVNNNKIPMVTGLEGARVVAVAQSVLKSLATGSKISDIY